MSRKLLCVLALACCSNAMIFARGIEMSGSLKTYIAYMWRGSRECGAHVAPCVTASWGNLSLQSFGYISFDGNYKEIDWDLSYKVGSFSFHLADYYCRLLPTDTSENYFDFRKGTTNHVQEAIVCYETKSLPFALRWFTFLHGNWIPEPDGTLGRPSFSSYLEAELYHNFTPDSRIALIGGASVLKGAYTSYTKDFAVINVELQYSHYFRIGAFSVPIHVSYIINPYARTSWLNAGTGIEF